MYHVREKTSDGHGSFTFHAPHQTSLETQSAENQYPAQREKSQGIHLHQMPQGRKSG